MTQPDNPTPQDPLTPLAILLQAMRDKWEAGDHEGAVAIAKVAAPYMHSRQRAAPTANSSLEVHRLSDAELSLRLAEARSRDCATPDDPRQPD